MSTYADDVTWYIADTWESYYASAVLSGIVGDAAHQKKNSYHNSLEDNPDQDGFSNYRPDDAAPPGDWPRNLASAIDMSMSDADMETCSWRLWNVWNDTSDPRREYVNAFNGWFNDSNPAKRYDYVSGDIDDTTDDHKWHVHLSIRRRWVQDMSAANAILSILRGDSKQDYLTGVDDMSWEQMLTAGADAGGGTYPASDWLIGANWKAWDSWENTELIKAQLDTLTAMVQSIVEAGGNPDSAVVLAGLDERLRAQRRFIRDSAEAARKRIEGAIAQRFPAS